MLLLDELTQVSAYLLSNLKNLQMVFSAAGFVAYFHFLTIFVSRLLFVSDQSHQRCVIQRSFQL